MKNTNKNLKRNKMPASQRRERYNNPNTRITNSPFLMPERLSVPLTFVQPVVINDASTPSANIRYRPSSAYDVDPALGGAKAYGFTEFSAFYGKYKVHSSTIEVDAVNLDNEPVVLYTLPVSLDPGANVSDDGPFYANPLRRSTILGAYLGNSKGRIKHFCTTKAISGVTNSAEDPYTASVGANPTDNWFWFLGIRHIGPNALHFGVSCDVRITLHVEFFDRKHLSSPASLFTTPTNKQAEYPAPVAVKIMSTEEKTEPRPGFVLPYGMKIVQQ